MRLLLAIGANVLAAMLLTLLVANRMPRWSTWRVRVVAAGLLPGSALLAAIVFDVVGYFQHRWHPDAGFMIGLSLMAALFCLPAFIVGIAAAAITGNARRMTGRSK